jgi:hypothetical protein
VAKLLLPKAIVQNDLYCLDYVLKQRKAFFFSNLYQSFETEIKEKGALAGELETPLLLAR